MVFPTRKHPLALKLIIIYWVSLLIPYSLVGGEVSLLAASSPSSSKSNTNTGTLRFQSSPSDFDKHAQLLEGLNRIKVSSPSSLSKDKSGPSTSYTETIATRKQDHVEFNSLEHQGIQKYIRVAKVEELANMLTDSMWSTMMAIGGVFFGVGSMILSWRVFWSIKEASQEEPVTITFLFSIPGIRYLNNHIRYHMFDTPLQPRRRFASFVGTGAFNKVDCLEDEFELNESVRKVALDGGLHTGKTRRRRESTLRYDIKSEDLITPPPSSPASHNPSTKSTPRRKSLARLSPHLEPQINESCLSDNSFKRHSLANISFDSDGISFVQKHPISPKLDLVNPKNVDLSGALHGGSSVDTIVEEENLDENLSNRPTTELDISMIRPSDRNLISPKPNYVLDSLSSLLDHEHREYMPVSRRSDSSSHRSSFSEEHDKVRLVTPVSLNLLEEDYSREKKAFMPEPPAYLVEPEEVSSAHHFTSAMIGIPQTSKLLRRINEGGTINTKQSKLSRYLQPQPISKSRDLHGDPIAQKLYQGDLTPPPGFNERSGGHGHIQNHHHSHSNSTNHAYTHHSTDDLGLNQSSRRLEEAMGDDIVFTDFLTQSQLINNGRQRRVSTIIPENQNGMVDALDESKSLLLGRRRLLSETHSHANFQPQQPYSQPPVPASTKVDGIFNRNWRSPSIYHVNDEESSIAVPSWSTTAGQAGKDTFRQGDIIPNRPRSALDAFLPTNSDYHESISGSRSSGRLSPSSSTREDPLSPSMVPLRNNHHLSAINLGIFDDIFRRQNDSDNNANL